MANAMTKRMTTTRIVPPWLFGRRTADCEADAPATGGALAIRGVGGGGGIFATAGGTGSPVGVGGPPAGTKGGGRGGGAGAWRRRAWGAATRRPGAARGAG